MKLVVPKKHMRKHIKNITDKYVTIEFPEHKTKVRFKYIPTEYGFYLEPATYADSSQLRRIVVDIANTSLQYALEKNLPQIEIKFKLLNDPNQNGDDGIPILPVPVRFRIQKGYYKVKEGFVSHIVIHRLLKNMLKNIHPLQFQYSAHRAVEVVIE